MPELQRFRWTLLVRADRIVSPRAFRGVDAITGALAAAWVALLVAVVPVVQPAQVDDAPGLGGLHLLLLLVAPVPVLLVLVMRALMTQVSSLRSDLEAVISVAIVVRIDVELARRTMSVGEFAERVGLTPADAAVLENGRAKAVRSSALEAVCRVLVCQPGDLLERVSDEVAAAPATS